MLVWVEFSVLRSTLLSWLLNCFRSCQGRSLWLRKNSVHTHLWHARITHLYSSDALCAVLTVLCAAVCVFVVPLTHRWAASETSVPVPSLGRDPHSGQCSNSPTAPSKQPRAAACLKVIFPPLLLWSVLLAFFAVYFFSLCWSKLSFNSSHCAPAAAAFNTCSRPVAPPPLLAGLFPVSGGGRGSHNQGGGILYPLVS